MCNSEIDPLDLRYKSPETPKNTVSATNGVGKGRHGPKLCPVRAPGPRIPPDAPGGQKTAKNPEKSGKSGLTLRGQRVPRSLRLSLRHKIDVAM